MTATREDFAALSAIINSFRIPRMLGWWPNSASPTELLQHNLYL
jgi:hypothetical protein